jgi:hypothetical protein
VPTSADAIAIDLSRMPGAPAGSTPAAAGPTRAVICASISGLAAFANLTDRATPMTTRRPPAPRRLPPLDRRAGWR